MIKSKDRGFYFGASDTDKIIGSWSSDTFAKWWLQKLSLSRNNFENGYTLAGTHFEHRILDSLNVSGMVLDKQIIIEDLRLRVNLDGNNLDTVYECKTYELEKGYSLPLKHINQVQVQMFATGYRKAYIVSYGLTEKDYKNYLTPIDKDRVRLFPIPYREEWINSTYLPRLKYLALCLSQGKFPSEKELMKHYA